MNGLRSGYRISKKSDDYLYDVSVVIVTYNPNWDSLKRTLDSTVTQKKITFEIVICDDVSIYNFKEELCKYFADKDFKLYTLIFHEQNSGTVKNLYSGLEKAKGKYTKVISPGDFFTDKTILFRWISFLEKKGAEWSFSDAYYYSGKNKKILRKKAHPQFFRPYIKNQKK